MRAFLAVLSLSLTASNGFTLNERVKRQAQYAVQQPDYGLPANYDFEWQVKDDYTRNDYGHQESRKDQQTHGSYHVALPDGRIQTVRYTVDGYGGYVAEVTYEGQAVYPEVKPYAPAYAPAAPAYAPAAPTYAPAPAPIPYAPAPVVSYAPQPTPAPYTPAPAPAYRPQPAPYRPQPIQPYASASVQTPTYALPSEPTPGVRRYTFRTASEAAAPAPSAEPEAAVEDLPTAESAPVPEVSSVDQPAVEDRSADVQEVIEATEKSMLEMATEETSPAAYRYYY